MTQHQPRIVTRPMRRVTPAWQLVVGGVVAGAVAVAAIWWWAAPGADADRLAEQLQQSQDARDQLARDMALLERGQEITAAANNDLRRQLIEVEGDQAQLREEIAFYRRLLDVGGSRRGLAIHDLSIGATASDRVFDYRLILSQNLNKASTISGRYDFSIDGVRGNAAAALSSAELGLDRQKLNFSFKYYQQLRGSVTLPADFQPAKLTVTATRNGQSKVVTRTFDWQPEVD